ncbi:MAG: hypothetical protein J6T33_08165 [Bacteroidales bacterium]|nr:hypothetical protein [Bacteroidales bacterium]MBO7541617.1 hypothetical protein [Bacteroidales bacterium]
MEALIKALLYIAEKQNIHLAIDPDDGKVYEVGEEGEELTRLHPISDPSQTVVEYDAERLVTLHNATALQRYCNGYLTEWQRLAIGRETAPQRATIGMTTGEQRIVNGFATDAERELIGAGKVNLPLFSTDCPPEVEAVARKIEQLLRRAISNTNKPATLETLIQYHRDAAKYAAAGNVFKLNQIEARLRGVVAKQGAIKTSEQTLARRRCRRVLLTKIAVAAVFAGVVGLWGYLKISTLTTNAPPQSTAASPTPPTESPADTTTALAAAFAEFEEITGKRLYQGGRDCITRAAIAAGVENNKQAIIKIIKDNVK